MRGLAPTVAAAALLSSGAALAQPVDYVVTEGALSDDDFYRLVACAAPPGGDCQKPFIHWPVYLAVNLRVAMRPGPPGLPFAFEQVARSYLALVIDDINAAGSDAYLRQVGPADPAEITIYLTAATGDAPVSDTGDPWLDGRDVGNALTMVQHDNDGGIIKAAIILSPDLGQFRARTVLLEELTQALGLTTDIRNPYYDNLSIFSQDGYQLNRLGDQDRMAIRRHYTW